MSSAEASTDMNEEKPHQNVIPSHSDAEGIPGDMSILSKYELNGNQLSLCQKIKEISLTQVIPEHLYEINNNTSNVINNSNYYNQNLNENENTLKIASRQNSTNIDAFFENGRISTAQEFYEWQSNLESLRVLEAEEKYKEYIFEFKGHLKKCQDIKELILLSISALDDIMDAYKASIQRSLIYF